MTDVTEPDDAPLTFQAYATRIHKSRPYVSKLVNEARVIHGPALTADRKIIPSIADAQRAAAKDPGRGRNGTPTADDADSPAPRSSEYASERTRKLAADRELAELAVARERGRYIDRSTALPAIAGFFRAIRDGVTLAVRENPDRPEDAVTDFFAAKAAELTHVFAAPGAPPGS